MLQAHKQLRQEMRPRPHFLTWFVPLVISLLFYLLTGRWELAFGPRREHVGKPTC